MRILASTGVILGGGAGILYVLFIGLPVVALIVKAAQGGGSWKIFPAVLP